MDQATFNREKKRARSPAWYPANGRDHSANLTVAVKTLTGLVKGVAASVLGAKVKRVGGKEAVTLANVLAYDKSNWVTDRAAQDTIKAQNAQILEQQAQLLSLLTGKKEA